MTHVLFALALLLPLSAAPALAQQHHHHPPAAGATADTAAVLAVADALREAIVAGDPAALERVVLADVRIHEGGKTESRAEYLGHHFGSDGAFLRAVKREPLTRTVEIDGHTARVVSTSRLHGTYRDRALDLESTEVLVLRHTLQGGWRVAEVRWSSEPRR
jgi:ketosteroid isomerase-like protein